MRTLIGMIVLLTAAPAAPAQSNIEDANKFAWQENVGWTNWRDADGGAQGVVVDASAGFLRGYIWAENVGWVDTGDGGGPYANTDGANHGVNVLPSGYLDGYAWSENTGWWNFGTEPFVGADGARYDEAAGRFRGYAWCENIGWLNLDDMDAFIGVAGCPADLDGSGDVNATDLGVLIAAWGSPTSNPAADFSGDGNVNATDLGILIAAWGSCG